MIGFTRALARKVGKDGTRVNLVMPGVIRISGCLEAICSSNQNVEVVPILHSDAQSGGRLSRETSNELCRIIQCGLNAAG